jgi:IS30 family transposase
MGYMPKKYNHFTKDERNELSILLKKGYSQRSIASVLRRSPPSIGREIKRNMINGEYVADKADHKAYVKRWNSKYQGMKIVKNGWLEDYIKEKLSRYWTPEEIARRLEYEYGYSVITFTSIYKWLYTGRGQAFCDYLPSKRYYRKARKGLSVKRTLIPNRIPIELRPNIVNLRGRCGDFEADTLGVPRASVATIAGAVDRKSRYLAVKKIERIGLAIDAFKEMNLSLQARSFTFDNGVENVRHESLEVSTYFCNAYSPWEKPTIENTFQRLRRFIPKKSLISKYSQQEIADICDIMNNTPRKCLGWRTPKEVFQEHLTKPTNTYQFIKKFISECCT